jgi:ABC-type tungstate transport system substrate-binding protein
VSARRLVPVGLAVAALLALAGIASHGRPLSRRGPGTGPTATFFDYVLTTLLLLAVVMLALVLYALFSDRGSTGAPRRRRWHIIATLVSFAVSVAVAILLLHTGFIDRLRRLEQQHLRQQQAGQVHQARPKQVKDVRNARVRWDEVAVFAAIVLGLAIAAIAARRSLGAPRPFRFERRTTVTQAIDDSIDDLRSDPNLRRAIIAAYARMEQALARSGLPRRPSEAPFEYMERALLELEASAHAAERLTDLFERAKFSQHEPLPEMRDNAIDALLAVRDELAQEAVTA